MTKSQILSHMSEKSGMTKAEVAKFFDDLAELAYSEAKNGFTIPGLGKLVLVDRKARVGRNPATGEEIQIPAKTVVKFRLSKACKEGVLSA